MLVTAARDLLNLRCTFKQASTEQQLGLSVMWSNAVLTTTLAACCWPSAPLQLQLVLLNQSHRC